MYLESFARDQVCFDARKLWRKPRKWETEQKVNNFRDRIGDQIPNSQTRRIVSPNLEQENVKPPQYTKHFAYSTCLPAVIVPVNLFTATIKKSPSKSKLIKSKDELVDKLRLDCCCLQPERSPAKVQNTKAGSNDRSLQYKWVVPRDEQRMFNFPSRNPRYTGINDEFRSYPHLKEVGGTEVCNLPGNPRLPNLRHFPVVTRQPQIHLNRSRQAEKLPALCTCNPRHFQSLMRQTHKTIISRDIQKVKISFDEILDDAQDSLDDNSANDCHYCFCLKKVQESRTALIGNHQFRQGKEHIRRNLMYSAYDSSSSDDGGSDTVNADGQEGSLDDDLFVERDVGEISEYESSDGGSSDDDDDDADDNDGDASGDSIDSSIYREELMEQEELDMARYGWKTGSGSDSVTTNEHSFGDSEEFFAFNSEDYYYGLHDYE